MVLFGMIFGMLLLLLITVFKEGCNHGGGGLVAFIVVAALLVALGIRKAFRLERTLYRQQAEPSPEALAETVLKLWTKQVNKGVSRELAWLSVRPRLRLLALAGLAGCGFTALSTYGVGVDEFLHNYYDRRWSGLAAVGGIALYGAGAFWELFRCTCKLTTEPGQLAEAMEHYRRFHNHAAVFALDPAWGFFSTFFV